MKSFLPLKKHSAIVGKFLGKKHFTPMKFLKFFEAYRKLPLFLHKGLVLNPERLNLAPPGPTLLQQPVQELVEKL